MVAKYTDGQRKEWLKMREEGYTYPEIALITEIPEGTLRSQLSLYKKRHGIVEVPKSTETKVSDKEIPKEVAVEKKPVSLSDFSSREIIKYLYSLGYRIDEGGLYVLEKKRVKLSSIITEDIKER